MPSWLRSLASKPALLARLLIGLLILAEIAIVVLGPDAKAARLAIAQAEAAHDPVTHWEPDADLGIHTAALLNIGLLALLAFTAGLWTRPFAAAAEDTVSPAHHRRPWWQGFAAPALVLLFAALYGASSFAAKSLWWDEMWAVKQCSLGTWKPDKKNPEEVKFQPTTWKKCAFYYQKPTNHAPMSLLQKVSLTLWQKLTHRPPSDFTELVIRAPALIASGIAIVLLLRLCGLAGGMPVMAGLLYLHPMHLHYGVDARAYALIVPLCLSAILAQRRILFRRGRTAWPWIWLALNQAAWIWVYPNAVLDVLVLFIVLGVFLWRGEISTKDRATALLRLLVAHVFAAALWLQLFLPNLMQARHWAGKEDQGHQLNASIVEDTLSQLAFGMNWNGFGESIEARGLTSLVQVSGSPIVASLLLVLFFALSLGGIIWAVRHTPKTGWLLAAPLISAVAYAAIGSLFGIYFYPRFVIATLPVLVVGLSLAGHVFSEWSQRRRLISCAILALYLLPTMHQRSLIMTRPHSAPRDAARYVQQWISSHPAPQEPLVMCYGLGREVMSVYYPKILPAASAADIAALEQRARAEHRPLLVIQGYTLFNRSQAADGMTLLDNRQLFAELAAWPALDPDFYFRVLEDKAVF
ncbi:MAG: hypothetical protein JWO94_3338 [Verrucomicrobiaceae bacterium]|nr:hypothetical protein [Verrucomicrobiaceae bacterium]